jgi:hypothetical protein
MQLTFEVKIDSRILYDYLLQHTYKSPSGLVGTLLGFVIFLGFLKFGYPIYLIASLVLIGYLPWTLYLKSKQQALTNPVFKNPIFYELNEEGMLVRSGEEEVHIPWDSMYKAVSTGKSIILYTSKIHATIFPRKDLKDLTIPVIEMISTHMPPQKVNIRN